MLQWRRVKNLGARLRRGWRSLEGTDVTFERPCWKHKMPKNEHRRTARRRDQTCQQIVALVDSGDVDAGGRYGRVMDDPTLSDREVHERSRKPYRVRLPVALSAIIAIVVLVAAAVMLKPNRAN
jgi:hypothetical protein